MWLSFVVVFDPARYRLDGNAIARLQRLWWMRHFLLALEPEILYSLPLSLSLSLSILRKYCKKKFWRLASACIINQRQTKSRLTKKYMKIEIFLNKINPCLCNFSTKLSFISPSLSLSPQPLPSITHLCIISFEGYIHITSCIHDWWSQKVCLKKTWNVKVLCKSIHIKGLLLSVPSIVSNFRRSTNIKV